MSVKGELYRIRNTQKEINELKQRIDEEYYSLLPQAIRYDLDKVQTSPQDRMPYVMGRIDEHTRIMCDRLSHLLVRKQWAEHLINKLEDTRQRQVLDLYFLSVERMTMKKIADKMGYSEQQTFRYYSEGLKNLENMRANESNRRDNI